MRSGVSLAFRAGAAVALIVLFYAMALAMIAVLVGLAVLLFASPMCLGSGRGILILLVVAVACLAAAGAIAWSVLPRLDRGGPPGPEIFEADHPRLFAEIRAVAAATAQRMPAHVYLVASVNAFVAQRGGILGFGSRRVMGVGVPLLRALQVDELRAVLAHEMGHFYGGDTRLGPWIYKTRGALARTVMNLARIRRSTAHWDGLGYVFAATQAPFRWFLRGFLRASQAISRAQEYSADAVSVRAEGSRAVVGGLKKTHAAAIAHEIYLRTEVLPLVVRGALPAVGEGFARFLAEGRLATFVEAAISDELADDTSDPYDSHPPLRQRIAAATALAGPDREPDPRPAIALVGDVGHVESAPLARQAGRKLDPVDWSDTARLWIALWRDEVQRASGVLEAVRVDAMPASPRAIHELAADALGRQQAAALGQDALRRWWISTAGAALSVLLVDAGFTLTPQIGEPFELTRGELTIAPFVELAHLLDGTLPVAEWDARWTERGLADRTLATARVPRRLARAS